MAEIPNRTLQRCLLYTSIQWLINQGVKTIFYPSVFYEHQEDPGAQNHFNCPMVIANPENIANNVEDIDGVRFLKPFLALTSEKVAAARLAHFFEDSFGIAPRKTREAVHAAWAEQLRAKADVRAEGARALQWMQDNGRPEMCIRDSACTAGIRVEPPTSSTRLRSAGLSPASLMA